MKKTFILPLAAMLIAGPAFAASVTVTPALSFNGSSGNVSSQPLTIATGSQPVTLKSISFSNSVFSLPAIPVPLTLGAGQTYTGPVTAQPRSTAQTGTLTIVTSAGTYKVALSETAIATKPTTPPTTPPKTPTPTAHSVSLSWKAPSSTPVAVNSYQINRAVSGSTSYSMVGTSAANTTSFTDTTVKSGTTYVYQVQSVDSSGDASNPSNSVTLAVP